VRKSIGRAMFETAMLKVQAEEAMLNPQAPKPVEKILTPEQRAARAAKANADAWAELNARWKREAAENDARRFGKSSSS
jgi:hypothetical protein